jgi:hypothetical protein
MIPSAALGKTLLLQMPRSGITRTWSSTWTGSGQSEIVLQVSRMEANDKILVIIFLLGLNRNSGLLNSVITNGKQPMFDFLTTLVTDEAV